MPTVIAKKKKIAGGPTLVIIWTRAAIVYKKTRLNFEHKNMIYIKRLSREQNN